MPIYCRTIISAIFKAERILSETDYCITAKRVIQEAGRGDGEGRCNFSSEGTSTVLVERKKNNNKSNNSNNSSNCSI